MESTLSARAGAADLRLIETLAWDGTAFTPRLPLHLQRLQRSAEKLGWRCDLARAQTALQEAAAPSQPARLRLTLDRAGLFEVQSAALPAPADHWRVGLSPLRLVSTDAWLSIKSSHRPTYDAARAALPAGLDEVILRNERDEVCDGSITNVFFDRGQGLRTPPLACGLLPGVLRAALALPEEVLQAADLPKVQLWVGNSLRGLIRTRFQT